VNRAVNRCNKLVFNMLLPFRITSCNFKKTDVLPGMDVVDNMVVGGIVAATLVGCGVVAGCDVAAYEEL